MKIGRKVLSLVISALLFLATGCATTGRSVGAGAGVGAGFGAGVGALADPGPGGENRIRNILIGTAVGGAVGAGAGYAADHLMKDEKDSSYQRGKGDAQKEISDRATISASNQPKLTPPRTEARWIPDQVRGATFVPGHFEYLIIENARWEAGR